MFAISPVLRLRVLLVAGLIAFTSLMVSQVANAQSNAPQDNPQVDCPTTDTVAQCVALLPSTGGIINLQSGTYISGWSELSGGFLTLPNITLIGAGMPQIGSTALISGSGTIIQGPLPVGADNFTANHLGVDVGPAVITSQYEGTAQDGIATQQYNSCGIGNCQWQNWDIENVSVIGQSPGALTHAVVITGVNNLIIKNLHTQFNTHGLATNGSTNVNVDGLYGRGHQGDCWIIKSGDAMTISTDHVTGSNINCSDYSVPGSSTAGDTDWGIHFQAEHGGNVQNVTIDGVNCQGMHFNCIVTDPFTGLYVKNVTITNYISAGSGQYDITLDGEGSGGNTVGFQLSNGSIQNAGGGAISIPPSSENVLFNGIDIDTGTGSGVAGIYNDGISSVFMDMVFSSTPPGNRLFYNDAGGRMWTYNITNTTGSTSYFILENGGPGESTTFDNGCSFQTPTKVYDEIKCGLTVTVTPGSFNIATTQTFSVTVSVSGNPTPTGSVILLGGGYISATATLSGGSATINIPAGSLNVGSDTLIASYTPDANSSSTYNSASGFSAAVTVTLPNPAPVISSLSPAFTSADGAAFTLTVNGTGFTANSTVNWGATALTTTYVSATQLTAPVAAAEIASAGTSPVTVVTPAPGGGTSNALTFEIDSSDSTGTPPSFSVATVAVAAGSPANYTVTLPSTVTAATANCLNLPSGASCSYSAGTVTITTSSSTPKGTYQIIVVFTETVTESASAWILLPILLLPLYFARKRLTRRGAWLSACVVLLLLTATATIIGCGGGGSSTNNQQPPPQTYQVISSGSVTLTVQ